MESFSLLGSVALGTLSSIIVQVLKRPELDYGWLKYIKTGKIAVFVVCIIATIVYAYFLGAVTFGSWQVAFINLLKVLVSAFLAYGLVVGQIGI